MISRSGRLEGTVKYFNNKLRGDPAWAGQVRQWETKTVEWLSKNIQFNYSTFNIWTLGFGIYLLPNYGFWTFRA
jgi:hypothetical protein